MIMLYYDHYNDYVYSKMINNKLDKELTFRIFIFEAFSKHLFQ